MFKRILLPVDGSHGSSKVIAQALSMAKAFDAKIVVLTIVDPCPFTAIGPEMSYGHAHYKAAEIRFAASAIEAARQEIKPHSLFEGSAIIESHIVWKGILDAADSFHADLLVMGSHGRRRLKSLVLGSVTQQVILHTKLPVLVVQNADGTEIERSTDTAQIWRCVKEVSQRMVHESRKR